MNADKPISPEDSVLSPQSSVLRKSWYRSLAEPPGATPEFPSLAEPSRRDFLKLAGFSIAAAGVAACARPPVGNAIPYLNAPADIVPGRAYWLASTCHGCPARCGVLVKCRDGRPIKLEGNPDHPFSRGGLCATGQAQVLGVYDSKRLRGPLANGKPSDWKSVDAAIAEKLASATRVRVVTQTLASPTATASIAKFLSRFQDGKHIVYDSISSSAILDAHAQTHGARVLPHYAFDKADTIVSLDADFLGTWISPVEFTRAWSSRRNAEGMSWHVQLEPRMSLTGSNADQRLRILPTDIATVLSALLLECGGHAAALDPLPFNPKILTRIAERLKRGPSLIISGSNRLEDQLLVNELNQLLGNYGKTVVIDKPSYQLQGADIPLDETVDAIFIAGNPVYELNGFEKLLARAPLVVSFSDHIDETSRHAHYVCPDHHFLESWGDTVAVDGVLTITQPAISPLGNTRAMIESFAKWSVGQALLPVPSPYDLVRQQWAGKIDWDKTLSDGFANVECAGHAGAFRAAARPPHSTSKPAAGKFALVLYPSLAMRDGRHAHNPWLHELPDPVTKITWDNVASISPNTAKALNIKDGDVLRINNDVELPAFVQPGQHDQVVAIALGYGRMGTDRFANLGPKWLQRRTLLAPGELVGRRVVHLPEIVTIEKTGAIRPIATTQLHSSLEGRNIVAEVSLDELRQEQAPEPHSDNGLWPEHAKGPHRWGMAIDLTRCTGCAGCVIACQAENNVPVVGKDEVLREREMHWIRIDRYYAGEGDDVETVHQPMMCGHCANASCESVCPVLATVHSAEGLNQQVYNRCVGTRYCANNCAYKVRRFNWFDYPHEERLANMVLNPDVTVRSRGVMEKCSMCVQRIEAAKIEAKRLGIPLADGAIQTACQQSCPADAIVFGDLNDPKSKVSAARRDKRHYIILEELNLQPGVGYLKKITGRAGVPPAGPAASRRREEPA